MADKDGICGNYSAFVLRIWCEPATGQVRGTLKNTSSGQSENFVSLAALLKSLQEQSTASVTENERFASFTQTSS